MTDPKPTSSSSPPPFPPHPKQTDLIDQQVQPERINPPRITYKSLPFASGQAEKNLSTNRKEDSNPYAEIQRNRKPVEYVPKKEREELIEANYLEKILSKEINRTEADAADTRQVSSNEVPICCYAPPSITYANGCKEIRKSLNYGKRKQIIDQTPCNHYLIGNETCEKCCKLITLNRNIFSLHCAWHHQLLTCSICKITLSDLEHRVYRGKVYCDECYKRTRHSHGCELQTVHRKKN